MNASPYPATQNIPEVAGQNAQAAQSVQLSGNQGTNQAMNPVLQALKIIGSSINAGQQKGNPRAGAQAQAFSGLLQSMASPELSQGQEQAPAQPQQAQAQPQAAPVAPAQPAAGPAPAPAQPGQKEAGQAPAARPSIPRRPLGQQGAPFGQRPGARAVSQQPINI
jgi:hypothetical protein